MGNEIAVDQPFPLAGSVRLRDVTASDLPLFFAHQQEPDANQMASFPARDWDTFMAHWSRIMANPTVLAQTILVDEQVAGNLVSWEAEGRQFVGYWIGKDWWGRGVASNGLAVFLKQVPARPLYACVVPDNVRSIRVLQKCGFALCSRLNRALPTPSDEVEELVFELGAVECGALSNPLTSLKAQGGAESATPFGEG